MIRRFFFTSLIESFLRAYINLKKIFEINMKVQNIVFIIVVMIYIYLAYNYLSNLKSCSCVEGEYVENVKTAEGFIMTVLLFWIFTNLMKRPNPIFSGALSVILFLTYIYFCYYVYQMNKTIRPQCLCAMKWQHWLVDIQYGVLLFEIFLVLFRFLL